MSPRGGPAGPSVRHRAESGTQMGRKSGDTGQGQAPRPLLCKGLTPEWGDSRAPVQGSVEWPGPLDSGQEWEGPPRDPSTPIPGTSFCSPRRHPAVLDTSQTRAGHPQAGAGPCLPSPALGPGRTWELEGPEDPWEREGSVGEEPGLGVPVLQGARGTFPAWAPTPRL